MQTVESALRTSFVFRLILISDRVVNAAPEDSQFA